MTPRGRGDDPPTTVVHQPPSGVGAALRLAPFRWLFCNSFLSWFGAGFMMITLQEFVIHTLHAAGRDEDVVRVVGLAPFFGLLPLFLFSIFAGSLADRVDRRRLLILGQTLRACLAVALALLYWSGGLTIVRAYALTFALGTTQAFIHPSRLSLIPNVVPPTYLLNAIALTNLSQHASMILGPVLAGFLILWSGVGGSFAVHALVLGAAVTPLLFLEVPQANGGHGNRPQPGVAGMLQEIAAGVRDAWRNRRLRALLFTTALPGLFFIGPFTALVPLLARAVYGSNVGGQGIMQMMMGLGLIAGGLLVARRHDLTGLGRKMVYVLVIGGTAWGLIGSLPSMAVGLPLLFIWGMTGGIFFNLNLTLMQREATDTIRGRLMSLTTLATQGCGPIGNLVATALAARIGAQTTIALGVERTIQLAGGCVVLAALGLIAARAHILRAD